MGDLHVGGLVGVILWNNTWKVERVIVMGRETSWTAGQLQWSLWRPQGVLKQACTLRTSPLRKWCAATVLHHSIASSGTVVPEDRHSLMRASFLQPSWSWGGPQSWLEGSNGTWALYSRFLQIAAFYRSISRWQHPLSLTFPVFSYTVSLAVGKPKNLWFL